MWLARVVSRRAAACVRSLARCTVNCGVPVPCCVVLLYAVVNGSVRLSSLYNCFMTIISNVSPYTRKLTMVASVKLTSLLEVRCCTPPPFTTTTTSPRTTFRAVLLGPVDGLRLHFLVGLGVALLLVSWHPACRRART
jgi:hypothetical protein